MIRKLVMMAALCALAAMSLASAASATNVQSMGVNVASGSTIGTVTGTDGVVGTAVLVTNLGNISCTTGGFAGTIGTNNGASTVTGSLTNLSFTGCTDSIPLITVSSCGTTTGSVAATGTTINVVTNVTCQTNIGTCIYGTGAGGVNGSYNNSTAEVTYSGVSVSYTGGSLGSGTCGATASFTSVFGPVVSNNTAGTTVAIV